MDDITVSIVEDEVCPHCGVVGSPKVCDEQGCWWWKCSTPYGACDIGYWLPSTGEIELKPEPAKIRETRDAALKRVEGLIPVIRNLPTGGKVVSFTTADNLSRFRANGYVTPDEDTVQPETYGSVIANLKEYT